MLWNTERLSGTANVSSSSATNQALATDASAPMSAVPTMKGHVHSSDRGNRTVAVETTAARVGKLEDRHVRRTTGKACRIVATALLKLDVLSVFSASF